MNKIKCYRVHLRAGWNEICFDFDDDVSAITMANMIFKSYNAEDSEAKIDTKILIIPEEEEKEETDGETE